MKHTVQVVEGAHAVWLTPEVQIEVVGEKFYEAHLTKIAGADLESLKATKLRNEDIESRRMWPQRVAWLVPEPHNQHDPNAVMVWVNGGTVGYIERMQAEMLQQKLNRLQQHYRLPIACRAWIKGKRSINVMLEVPNDWFGGE